MFLSNGFVSGEELECCNAFIALLQTVIHLCCGRLSGQQYVTVQVQGGLLMK